jgi:hypothetical protein
MSKTEKFSVLDSSIPHGRYMPNDNVVRIFTETFDCTQTSEISETNRLRLLHAFGNILGMKISADLINDTTLTNYNKIIVDIETDCIKIQGLNNTEKSFYIEITKPRI